ncbi:O-methyltransferase [Spirosoma sordidisoli]|uniref:Methyltransferase domain-containing protein n=1 Tax=Spirosoma sordidisoli TaxID=2502893 RepID=A0A4V1RVP2_9BACT|nr:class I SAM-dependent methyltransferase [Spirosoma sordidisoli]RYC67458.1 methyltransferase domain-containing protein [Spirosoma sordidisoli]
MYSDDIHTLPPAYADIEAASQTIRFSMPSDRQTGAILKMLAASKPKSKLLEIGTGTGLATAWLLAGMDADSTLTSIDNEPAYQAIARQVLGADDRLQLVCTDAGNWLETTDQTFDLIFADAWPGKYANLDATLNALAPGGLYVLDDMLPQPNWPDGHGDNVDKLVRELEGRHDLHLVKLAWSTGLLIASRN